MSRHIMCVFSNPVGSEEEFNKWYDEVHVPEVLKYAAFFAGQRFKLCESQVPGTDEMKNRYLCIYEIETDDIDKFITMSGRGGTPIATPIDPATMQRIFYSSLGPRQTK